MNDLVSGSTRPNVLFVIIDSLRGDYLDADSRGVLLAPRLHALASSGISSSRSYVAGGCATQFSLPSIFTSTMSLDQGGYDDGIVGREHTFPELLAKHDYTTAAFTCGYAMSPMYGYERGFSHFYYGSDLSCYFAGFLNHSVDELRASLKAETMTLDEAARLVVARFERLFDLIEAYWSQKSREIEKRRHPFSPILHRWIEPEMRARLERCEHDFRADADAFARDVLVGSGTPAVLQDVASQYDETARHASGARLVDTALDWLDEASEQPFFAWLHLMDVHDCSFTSFGTSPDRQLAEQNFLRILRAYQQLAQSGQTEGNHRYDLAVAYADWQLDRLYQWLAQNGMLDNTLIVVASDHGTRFSGLPQRERRDVVDFFDERIRTPVVFSHPALEMHDHDPVCSHLDIAPALLTLLDISVPTSFQGSHEHLFGGVDRDVTISEHFGRGICDPYRKPAHLCVRTRAAKLVVHDHLARPIDEASVTEFYDLDTDPLEQHNLLEGPALSPHQRMCLYQLQRHARARGQQLRETWIHQSSRVGLSVKAGTALP